MTTEHLTPPHGGELCNLIVDEDRAEQLKAESGNFSSVTLNLRQICDLELLINGGFSPLRGFMGQATYDSVVSDMRLPDGRLWSIPITLDIPGDMAAGLGAGDRLALRDSEGFMLAALTIEDVWQPDKLREAQEVYGTTSTDHPGVRYLLCLLYTSDAADDLYTV